MDSSVDYQKLSKSSQQATDSEKSSHHELQCHSKSTVITTLVLVIIFVAVFLVAIFAIGIGVGVGVSQQNEAQTQTGLTVITLSRTPSELEGKYTSLDGAGSIHFRSTVNETYFVLSIFTTNGELYVTIIQPLYSNMTMMGVNDTYFLVMKDQPNHPKFDDYIIPNGMMNTMESVMSGQREMTDSILSHLDKSHVDNVRETTLKEFAMSQEAVLIIEAALSLGRQGIQGTDYPAVMQFYQLALRLVKTRLNTVNNFESTNDRGSRSVRNVLSDNDVRFRAKRLFNIDSICETTDRSFEGCAVAPYPNSFAGDNCFGLCGYDCCCWEFVCGDCCLHRFCETHDGCCAEKGFFTFDCFRVAGAGPEILFDRGSSLCEEDYDC